LIAGEERRASQLMQQRNNIVTIFHSAPADLETDLTAMNLQDIQPVALALHDVFITNDHAARFRLSICFSVFSSNALHARLIASSIERFTFLHSRN
jgi:hypothetical protein